MPLMTVASEAAPVPKVCKFKVAVNAPVAPLSVAVVLPDSVTVAVSLSVIVTESEPEPPIV